jgi:hypothetical protein
MKRWGSVVMAGLLAAAVGGAAFAAPALARTSSTRATAVLAAPPLEGVPHYDHIVVLTLENESATATFGPGSPATYLNSLRAQGVFLPNYYGVSHVSLDNYIAMTSGEPPNGITNTDCSTVSLYVCAQSTALFSNGRNLADQLEEQGLSWKAYLDGAPTTCFHGPYSTDPTALLTPDPYQGDSQTPPAKDYADRHNPFIYYPDVVGNQARCDAHERPYTELAGDLSGDTLPAFSFVTPDTCHDGHDDPCSNGQPGGLVAADAWLSQNLPPLISYLQAHDGLLVINFDEGGFPTSLTGLNLSDYLCPTCSSLGLGGRTGAVLLGAGLRAGETVTTSYDHYSLLRTVEDSLGIGEHLNLAALATPMAAALAS